MSISLLQNSPWLNMNIGSVVQAVPLNVVLGNCSFLGTNVPAANYTANAYVLGNIVLMSVNLPATAATGTVTQISFANALPANLRPAANAQCEVHNIVGGLTSSPTISAVGALRLDTTANSTGGTNYAINYVISYSLV